MQDKYFSDEELVAYLDGESDFAPVEEIALALKNDAALAKRLEGLRVNTHLIADSFSALKGDDSFVPNLPKPQKVEKSYRAIAASVFVALSVGFGAGYVLNTSTSAQSWQEYAAAYHYLYTTSTLANVNRPEQVMQDELKRVSAAIGKELSIEQLEVSTEIEYKRAQILGFEGKALIQLAFLTSTGEPLALCIIRSETNKSFNSVLKTYEGMSSVVWADDGYEYILIGGTNDPLVVRAAEKISEQIQEVG